MDPILYWNEVALEANRVSHTNGKQEQTGPTLSSRALAIVHLAMYDAYAGVKPGPKVPPYWPGLTPAAGASADAAVAAAAHATLSALFPSQKAFFNLKHAQAGLTGPGLPAGHAYGLAVAARLLQDRKDDPNASDNGYAASMARGAHRPDPDNPNQGFHGPFYGARSKGFAINKRHELDVPPQPGSADYRKALRQVRGKGIAPDLMGTLPVGVNGIAPRTVDETLIGLYWGYDGAAGLGTPPRLYNQIIREIAIAKPNDTADNARLFALVNVAMGDAGILAWDQKYIHDLWRPVLGVREHDPSLGPTGTDGNDINNDSDIGWLPLGAPSTNALAQGFTPSTESYPCAHVITGVPKNFTPPFPAYPSGHATFGAAAFHITRRFYKVTGTAGDNLFDGLAFVSEELNGVNTDNRGTVRPRHERNFPKGGLWQMIVENGFSRVFLGVHWFFDAFALDKKGDPDVTKNIGGVPLGLTIANDIFDTGMKRNNNVPPRY
jgi:vanadium chloroperoxidase